MGTPGITVLPYIDPKAYENATAASNSDSKDKPDSNISFDQALSAAQKATAALAIDALVAASDSGTVDAQTVQTFFNEHNIKITVAAPESSVSTPPTAAPAPDSSEPAVSDASGSSNNSDSELLKCSEELDQYFEEAAKTYGVDVKFLKAIAKQESNFDPNATSHSGAMGIMQLMPFTAKELGVENAYDPRSNIMGGAKLISQLLEKYNGDKSLALAAYNAGSGNVKKYGGIPPFEETQNYVKKVLEYYNS